MTKTPKNRYLPILALSVAMCGCSEKRSVAPAESDRPLETETEKADPGSENEASDESETGDEPESSDSE